ncbi:hypothetical protein KKF91_05235, partial [Myxococcota bacterium]|nr:hypothetical protein [Myxococcota bacterium]
LAWMACSGPQPVHQAMAPLTPKKNFFMRNSFDTDPSAYLGRFVPKGTPLSEIDDAAALRKTCSQFFTIRKVGGGGVIYDEIFHASSQVSAGLSIPDNIPVTMGIQGQSGKAVRVRYNLKEKWIADLNDPAGFARCCAQADDACTDQILGEFISGTGTIFYALGEASKGGSGVGDVGGVTFKDGFAWRQSIEMPNPVFFAFKLTQTPTTQRTGDWCERPPRVAHGKYVCGVSEWIDSERKARDLALFEARRQLLKYISEKISDDATLRESVSGNAQNLQTMFGENTDHLSRAAGGIARFVEAEEWKVDQEQAAGGWKYRAKVLAFMPNTSLLQAAKEAVQAGR